MPQMVGVKVWINLLNRKINLELPISHCIQNCETSSTIFPREKKKSRLRALQHLKTHTSKKGSQANNCNNRIPSHPSQVFRGFSSTHKINKPTLKIHWGHTIVLVVLPLPSLKLTLRPKKWMVGMLRIPIRSPPIFRCELLVSVRVYLLGQRTQ